MQWGLLMITLLSTFNMTMFLYILAKKKSAHDKRS